METFAGLRMRQFERLWIVDGTLVPVRDRTTGASSRNYRFSANVQVIIDADTKLVIAAARPVPGNTADAKARRESGLAQPCQGVTVLADGAYIITGLVIPHRERPGRALLPGEEEDNAEHWWPRPQADSFAIRAPDGAHAMSRQCDRCGWRDRRMCMRRSGRRKAGPRRPEGSVSPRALAPVLVTRTRMVLVPVRRTSVTSRR